MTQQQGPKSKKQRVRGYLPSEEGLRKLEEKRFEKGFSYEALAVEAGLASDDQVKRLFHPHWGRRVQKETIEKIARVLDLKPTEIVAADQFNPSAVGDQLSETSTMQEPTDSINDWDTRQNSLKYYLYLSETKINMLYPQISNQDNGTETLFSKVKVIHNYLDKNKMIGSLGDPAAYIYGKMPMNWGCLREYASDIVFFGTQKTTDTIILLGSKYSLVGQSKAIATEHSSDYYFFKFFNRNLDHFRESILFSSIDNSEVSPWDDENLPYFQGLKSFNRFMSKVDHKGESVEFLARMLVIYKQSSERIMIATPIYVALDDEPSIK